MFSPTSCMFNPVTWLLQAFSILNVKGLMQDNLRGEDNNEYALDVKH